jgi:hypothetical protein
MPIFELIMNKSYNQQNNLESFQSSNLICSHQSLTTKSLSNEIINIT